MICLKGANLHKIPLPIFHRRGSDVVLVGQTKGNRPHGRRRRWWEDNSKMYLQENELGH